VEVLKSSAHITIALAMLLLPGARLSFGQTSSEPPPEPGQTRQGSQTPFTSLPNTVSARPLTVADKLDYRVVQSFGLRGVAGAAVSAAIGQAHNSPHEWGQGVEGFSERFGSAFAGNMSRQTFAFVIESALHEDPRYFPSEDKSKKLRIVNALKQVIVCKTDNGKSSFAYGRVVSEFGAGQFVNLWQPNSINGFGNGIERSFIGLGGDFAYNMMQEFVPFTRPRQLRHRH
jgi:hypothetical protein